MVKIQYRLGKRVSKTEDSWRKAAAGGACMDDGRRLAGLASRPDAAVWSRIQRLRKTNL